VNQERLEMIRGDNQQFTIAAQVTAGGVTTIPDISSWTIWMTGKLDKADSDAEALFQIKTPTEIEITDGAGGIAVATLPTTATSSLTGTTVVYFDVQGKEGGGAIHTLAIGTIKVLVDVTVDTT